MAEQTEYPDKCTVLSVNSWRVTVLWAGMIGKSRWKGLYGEGSGDTYEAAKAAAIEAAKASRLPKVA